MAADADLAGLADFDSGDPAFSYLRPSSWVWIVSLAGMGPRPLRTEAPRDGRSLSGGGVGGKTLLRLVGGSDCCLRDCKPGFTRFVAAYDTFSVGLSSLDSVLTACVRRYISIGVHERSKRARMWRRGKEEAATHVSDFGASKACKSIGAVGSCDEPGLAEVVLCLEVADLCLVWPVNDADWDREDCVALHSVLVLLARAMTTRHCACLHRNECEPTHLCFLSNCLVNDVVILHDLLLDGVRQVLHTGVLLLQVDVAQAAVEENFARVQLEEEAELGVIDHCVSAQVEEGVVEIGESLFEVAEEEVGNALLEIGDGKILI